MIPLVNCRSFFYLTARVVHCECGKDSVEIVAQTQKRVVKLNNACLKHIRVVEFYSPLFC
ncbi:unknown [Prevotella sp. CAG:891]|nr:unknown [Prevotella sp. CAG:891]